MNKKELRKYMMNYRIKLSPLQVKQYSAEVFENFLNSDLTDYDNYMAYLPIRNETDTHDLINYLLEKGKKVSVPFINENNRLVPVMIDNNTVYEIDPFGIQIPINKTYISPLSLNVIFVPGLAFDKKGNRVGYGKGYYDAFLRELDCITCAWCYNFQIIDDIEDTSFFDVKIKRFL
ncbi:MAG: 5-formyltetrahydrofolate cyclo-ligase [Clostridia bacterium]|jgi:5-formyltetrahydrofolate cyclo-ligase